MEKSKVYKIDAKGKVLGRLATEVANILNGKNTPQYTKNVVPDISVEVSNIDLISIPPKKIEQKEYLRYSGYPGGLKKLTMRQIIDKHGYGYVFRKAVYGMLPPNKLRSLKLKNLTIQ